VPVVFGVCNDWLFDSGLMDDPGEYMGSKGICGVPRPTYDPIFNTAPEYEDGEQFKYWHIWQQGEGEVKPASGLCATGTASVGTVCTAAQLLAGCVDSLAGTACIKLSTTWRHASSVTPPATQNGKLATGARSPRPRRPSRKFAGTAVRATPRRWH
jgi:hypothetical protein